MRWNAPGGTPPTMECSRRYITHGNGGKRLARRRRQLIRGKQDVCITRRGIMCTYDRRDRLPTHDRGGTTTTRYVCLLVASRQDPETLGEPRKARNPTCDGQLAGTIPHGDGGPTCPATSLAAQALRHRELHATLGMSGAIVVGPRPARMQRGRSIRHPLPADRGAQEWEGGASRRWPTDHTQ